MPIDYQHALELRTTDRRFSYGEKDTILYALGIGLGANPLNDRERRFVYEDGLIVFPTMATVVAWGADALIETGLDFSKLVQGEQRLTVHKPLPPSAQISADWRVDAIVDKGEGKGALIVHTFEISLTETGERLATLGRTSFARGDGGFGGPTSGAPAPHSLPARPADRETEIVIPANLALIYRLSGDLNPLHADPAVAHRAGFPVPILHGMCTYGIACRAILQCWADLDPAALRQFDVRFSAPVFPGDLILVRSWRDGDIVSFEATVPARGVTVLTNGRAELAAIHQ